MVQRVEKTLYNVKGSYYLVVPMHFIKEHGLKDHPVVEVFTNGELLIRPLRRPASNCEKEVDDGD